MANVHIEVADDLLAHARTWAADKSWEILEKRLADLDADLLTRAALAGSDVHDLYKGHLEGARYALSVIRDVRDNLLTPRNR